MKVYALQTCQVKLKWFFLIKKKEILQFTFTFLFDKSRKDKNYYFSSSDDNKIFSLFRKQDFSQFSQNEQF